MIKYDFFVSSPQGTEPLLAQELKSFGAQRVRPAQGGVSFQGGLHVAYSVCLWSRIASRLLLPLSRFSVRSAEDLYAGVREMAWEEHMGVESTLAVDFSGTNVAIKHSNFGSLKVKDAIVDRFRDLHGVRPSVRLQRPDVRIHVRLRNDRAVVGLDLSGEGLHRRGYRVQSGEASLKENLAAALLMFSGWPELSGAGGGFLDPMCGSGTLPIEAALMAADCPPGLSRDYHGFLGWRQHDAEIWRLLLADAHARATEGLAKLPLLHGYDADPRAVEAAEANASKAGLAGKIRFDCLRLETLIQEPPPQGLGLVLVNPPYGERMGDAEGVERLYHRLGEVIQQRYSHWHCGIFTGVAFADHSLGMRPEKSWNLNNGTLACQLLYFPPGVTAPRLRKMSEDAEMFANRLRKNLKKYKKWCAGGDISCYRIYDADMPEFALALDVYESSVHVQEYLPPSSVDPQRARERLQSALSVIPEVLGVNERDVHFKLRQRGQGGERQGEFATRTLFTEVGEGGLRFLVNFDSHLDTGLFLDHRQVRDFIRQRSMDGRFLNLFGYTGTATVYAAAGGARETITVDLSNTYLEWARKNMDRNGFSGPRHHFERADCFQWLETTKGKFDLIFLDPPSFSNSKRMEQSLNLKRDHVWLIRRALARLAPGGLLLFSNNFQRFKLDLDALGSGLDIQDITRQTLPLDFERRHKTHHCWTIQPIKEKNRV